MEKRTAESAAARQAQLSIDRHAQLQQQMAAAQAASDAERAHRDAAATEALAAARSETAAAHLQVRRVDCMCWTWVGIAMRLRSSLLQVATLPVGGSQALGMPAVCM